MADGEAGLTASGCVSPKVRKKKSAHRIDFFRKKQYFTKGHEHLGAGRDVNAEQSPFLHPPCSLMFSYFQYWKVKKSMGQRKRRMYIHSRKPRNERLQRLRVDVEIEALEAKKHKDFDEAIAITDVDPKYFTELGGRPVKERFAFRRYIEENRSIFRTRLLAGQEVDDCIRVEQQYIEEQKGLDKIKHCYRRYVSGYEEFLSKDHEDSMKYLERADNEVKITREIAAKRNYLSKEFGRVRLEVYRCEENWRMVKMCQRFLFMVSPTPWRAEHDWIFRSESKEDVLSNSIDNLFGRYRTLDDATSLETLIELFHQDIEEAGPTELYFEAPMDLIRVFRVVATQNLNALIHLESMAQPMADLIVTIEVAEEQIKTRVAELTNAINEVQASINKLEERAAELETYASTLLNSVFRSAVCSEEVLRFQVFIEDAYESCIGPNDANLDSFSMMKWIEKTHEDLNLELDTLPPEVVQACAVEGFKQEMRAMKETEEAAKKFELMHQLLASLKRIMEPPVQKGRPLMRRSVPAVRKAKPPPPPPEPTAEEMDYLNYFTNYCNFEDFTEYRSKFPDDFDLAFKPRPRKASHESVDESGNAAADKETSDEEASDEEASDEEDKTSSVTAEG